MQKKIMWLGLCVLLVAATVLSSCKTTTTPATVTSTATTTATATSTTTATATTTAVQTTSTTAASNVPTYGGTFTYFGEFANQAFVSWDDVTTGGIAATQFNNPYAESLVKGDIDTFGPRGNNSFDFQHSLTSQIQSYYGGELAASWEMTSNPLGVIYHLKKGIMFTGNANIGMPARELTAADVVYHYNRNLTSSVLAGLYSSYVKSVTATDNYTVTVVFDHFFAQWESPIGLDGGVQAMIIPQEVVKAGANNWKNQCGTGPWILTDFVADSYASYTRNPNYWGQATINGKTYAEPFIQKLVYPIITDDSTQIAALRTGKIDMWPKVATTYQDSLAKSSPDMIMKKWLVCRVDMLRFNALTSKYFTNKDVRRAMMVATDFQAITDSVYQGGDNFGFPFAAGIPSYTPINQLPAADQLLYKYDPTAAKKMLADAGYPNGFSCEVTINSSNANWNDVAQTLVSQWAKAGVTLTIDKLDDTAYQASYSKILYADSIMEVYSTDDAWAVLYSNRSGNEGVALNDPVFNTMFDKAQATPDVASQVAQQKAMGVYSIDNAFSIGFTNPIMLNCYWPWVKNYYGEISAGNYGDITAFAKEIWIDQNLKTSLGY